MDADTEMRAALIHAAAKGASGDPDFILESDGRVVDEILAELRRRGAWLPGSVPTPEMIEAVRNMERQ